MADRLLTTRELQDLLQLDRVTIYKMVKEGELPALRVGGQWRFSAESIATWMERTRAGAQPAQGVREPLSDLSKMALPDLIAVDTLQAIQNQFAELLGVASFGLDRDGQPYAPCSHCSRFCHLVRSTRAGADGCRESWRKIVQLGQAGAIVSTCHAGIQYAAAPVVVGNQVVGMVTAGQFLTEQPDAEAFRQQALATGQRIGVDGEALAGTVTGLEVVSEERALQITGLLATIASTLSAIGYQGYQMRRRLAQIAELSSDPPANAAQ